MQSEKASTSHGIRAVALAVILGGMVAPLSAVCPGDIDGDDAVAVGDLLAVLADWGPTTPCPPMLPADLDGNCQVDVTDLLTVLALWGPRPPAPTGGCCLTDGSCAPLTEIDCTGADGTYLGDASECGGSGACGAGVVGACCLPSGMCVGVDVPACAALGGAYQGAGVACATDPCP